MRLVGSESLLTDPDAKAFDLGELLGAGTWSCFELVRAARGEPVTPAEADVAAAYGAILAPVRKILKEGVLSSVDETSAMNRIGFIDTVVWTWSSGLGPGLSTPPLLYRMLDWSAECGHETGGFSQPSASEIWAMLRAVDRRFPHLLVKFYAERAMDLHERYWSSATSAIIRLVREGAAYRNEAVKAAFERMVEDMNRRTAFVS